MNIPQVMVEISKYGVLRAAYLAKEKEMDEQEMKIRREILPKLIEDKTRDFIAEIFQLVFEDVPHQYQVRLLAKLNSERGEE